MYTGQSSRRSFLGHVGLTAAAAAGLALIPSAAQADVAQSGTRPARAGRGKQQAPTYRCCVSTCINCGPGQVGYYCTVLVGGCGSSYCTTTCGASRGTCYYQYGC